MGNNRSYGWAFIVFWTVLLTATTPRGGLALSPDEILIVANENVEEGVGLARYYAERRGVPKTQLLLLSLPVQETCGRDVYERHVAAPVRAYLAAVKPSWRIRCLVMMFGMPLKVAPSDKAEMEAVQALSARKRVLERAIENQEEEGSSALPDAPAVELEDVRRRLNELRVTADGWASVDSELSIVRASGAPVGGWIENPFHPSSRGQPPVVSRDEVLMVSRLDGPAAAGVRRMIDDSVSVESTGLTGVAYFDARWPMAQEPPPSAYHAYDRAIHRTAVLVKKTGRMPVVVDDTQALFGPGQCPDAALYCGWYSLAAYVDAFTWKRGAVGFHVASSECTTLKKENSQVWCKRMLEKGVCATVGPVGEPYLQSFPTPELFFGLLTEGVLSLAECYMLSLPYLSWKMVLIGDPLYRPFQKR